MVRRFGKVGVDLFHSFLREMDIVFGYGNTFDEKAILKFSKTDRIENIMEGCDRGCFYW